MLHRLSRSRSPTNIYMNRVEQNKTNKAFASGSQVHNVSCFASHIFHLSISPFLLSLFLTCSVDYCARLYPQDRFLHSVLHKLQQTQKDTDQPLSVSLKKSFVFSTFSTHCKNKNGTQESPSLSCTRRRRVSRQTYLPPLQSLYSQSFRIARGIVQEKLLADGKNALRSPQSPCKMLSPSFGTPTYLC